MRLVCTNVNIMMAAVGIERSVNVIVNTVVSAVETRERFVNANTVVAGVGLGRSVNPTSKFQLNLVFKLISTETC